MYVGLAVIDVNETFFKTRTFHQQRHGLNYFIGQEAAIFRQTATDF